MILTIFFLNTTSHILIDVGNFYVKKYIKNTLQLYFYVLQYKHNKERNRTSGMVKKYEADNGRIKIQNKFIQIRT